MIVTSQNINTRVLSDIISTLGQMKISEQANRPLLIEQTQGLGNPTLSWETLTTAQWETLTNVQFEQLGLTGVVYSLTFFTDSELTRPLFTDDSGTSPSRFSVQSGKVFYTPDDSVLNNCPTVSNQFAQSVYYVQVTSTAGLSKVVPYRNADNLIFQSVIVSSKPNPKFTTNENMAIVVPVSEKEYTLPMSGSVVQVVASYDVYLALTIFNWATLSEQERISQGQQINNVVRNALYSDRYRNGTCTFRDRDLDGTYVAEIKVQPSEAVLKGVVRVQCCWFVSTSGY